MGLLEVMLADGPTALWSLDEAAAPYADLTGNGHGSVSSSGTLLPRRAQVIPDGDPRFGIADTAGVLQLGDPGFDWSTGAISVSWWQKLLSNTGGVTKMIWSRALWANGGKYAMGVYIHSTAGMSVYINEPTQGDDYYYFIQANAAVAANFPVGVAMHFGITVDSSNVMRFYVNGRPVLIDVQQGPTYNQGQMASVTLPRRNNNGDGFRIGYPGAYAAADVAIGPFGVYRSKLSDAQMLRHYGEGIRSGFGKGYSKAVLLDSPAGYWPLDESSGSAIDASGNGHTGAVASVTRGAPALVSPAAASFAGSSTVQIPSSTAFDPTGGLTAEAWIKTADASLASILDRDSQTGTRLWQFRLYLRVVNWLLFFSGGPVGLAGNKVLDDNIWHHIVGTYDGAFMRIYVDGVLDAEAAQTGAVNTGSVPIWMGNAQFGSGQSYTGSIDEAAVYPTALSADRIAAHYREGVRRGVSY